MPTAIDNQSQTDSISTYNRETQTEASTKNDEKDPQPDVDAAKKDGQGPQPDVDAAKKDAQDPQPAQNASKESEHFESIELYIVKTKGNPQRAKSEALAKAQAHLPAKGGLIGIKSPPKEQPKEKSPGSVEANGKDAGEVAKKDGQGPQPDVDAAKKDAQGTQPDQNAAKKEGQGPQPDVDAAKKGRKKVEQFEASSRINITRDVENVPVAPPAVKDDKNKVQPVGQIGNGAPTQQGAGKEETPVLPAVKDDKNKVQPAGQIGNGASTQQGAGKEETAGKGQGLQSEGNGPVLTDQGPQADNGKPAVGQSGQPPPGTDKGPGLQTFVATAYSPPTSKVGKATAFATIKSKVARGKIGKKSKDQISNHSKIPLQVAVGAALGCTAGYMDSKYIEPFGYIFGGSLLLLQVLDHEGMVAWFWNDQSRQKKSF